MDSGSFFNKETKVGLFVVVGVITLLFGVLFLGGPTNFLTHKAEYKVHFISVEGLVPGAKVQLSGIHIGIVKKVELDPNTRTIQVGFQVDREYSTWIRADSYAEISTQGVLGDKFIQITQGTPEQALLPLGSEIPARESKGLSQFLSKTDQALLSITGVLQSLERVLKSLESKNRSEIMFQGLADTARNLGQVSERMNREIADNKLKNILRNLEMITDKINNGTGTIGALINDPGLYDDIRSLTGAANRNRIVRNLIRDSLKKSEQNPAPAKH